MIFVGEHTSYTHAWIASALESGIRGSVQLMLELGLVDEAKATVEKWMARWIEVVSILNVYELVEKHLLILSAVMIYLRLSFHNLFNINRENRNDVVGTSSTSTHGTICMTAHRNQFQFVS